MTLEQSLRDMLVKHNLRAIQLEVAEYNNLPEASVFWNDATAEYGCRMAKVVEETFAEALSKAITIANDRRGMTHVTLPDDPIVVEV